MTEQEVLVDIRERLVRVETKLDGHNSLRDKVVSLENKLTETETCSKAHSKQLNQLEENNRWLWRTVVGAIIAAAVGAFVIFK